MDKTGLNRKYNGATGKQGARKGGPFVGSLGNDLNY